MPVSTRSHNLSSRAQNDARKRAPITKDEQDEILERNPHQDLKEKMKALTRLYEEHKKHSLRDPHRFSTYPIVDLLNSGNRGEKEPNPKVGCPSTREKENTVTKIESAPVLRRDLKKNDGVWPQRAARKLSMAAGKENVPNRETVLEKIRGDQSRILVFVRLRPMGKKETEAGSKCCVKIVNKRDVYLTEFANENDYLRLKRLRGRYFTFDASFPESTPQHEIYSTTTADLVEAVLQGRNGSVFSYGATGAGKTYTMLGTVENPGVMVLAIKDLFDKISRRSYDGHHAVHLSYLEVYNEAVRDLLSPGRPLVLREDKQGIVAAGLTQYQAHSTDEVMALLQQGNLNRTTEPTRANETSSRSHAILQVVIEYQVKDASGIISNRVGKLSLIDLAGSERALATDQRTLRSLEGANINRSLLALSNCINALVEGKKHIPYRNSKLTQLLKDSLGGVCNTVMIANISPSSLSFGETQNTLHWADRAKEIRLKDNDTNEEIQIPDCGTDQAKLLLELQKENRELRVELAQLRLLKIQAQTLAANSSPTASDVSSFLSPHPSSAKPNGNQKLRSPFMAGNCFTSEPKNRAADDTLKHLQKTVKAKDAEIDRIKKDHELQMKQKDNLISELSRKIIELGGAGPERSNRVLTRAMSKPKESLLKSSNHRFLSPAPKAKKRSFWDITTANSPSIDTVKGRKARSQFISEPAANPSMLLQPGFARQRIGTLKP